MKNITNKKYVLDGENPQEFRARLQKWEACPEVIEWAKGRSLARAWIECPRGDWLLWLHRWLYPAMERERVLAAGYCAHTVRHLMRDQRSRDAVDAAIAYGAGRISEDELTAAHAAADAAAYAAGAAADAAAHAAAYAARAAADADGSAGYAEANAYYAAADADGAAAYAAHAAANAATHAAAYASYAAAHAAADADGAADDADNQQQTADICRKYLRWDYD